MKKLNQISSVIVPVAHYLPDNVITRENVKFTIFREHDSFKAVPVLSNEARLVTGLPEALEFVYFNYCIVKANNMEEETLDAIKQIILELEVQEYFS